MDPPLRTRHMITGIRFDTNVSKCTDFRQFCIASPYPDLCAGINNDKLDNHIIFVIRLGSTRPLLDLKLGIPMLKLFQLSPSLLSDNLVPHMYLWL